MQRFDKAIQSYEPSERPFLIREIVLLPMRCVATLHARTLTSQPVTVSPVLVRTRLLRKIFLHLDHCSVSASPLGQSGM